MDNSDNYSRVNKLLKEQVDTLTQIKYLQNAIESGNLSEEEEIAAKKLMVSLTDKLGAVEGKYNDELTSTYKKTKRIQEVLDRIGKNKDLGVDGFKLDSVINSDKAIKDITDIISALQKTDAAMEKLSHEGKTDIFKTAFEDAQIQIAKLNKQLLSVDIDPKEYSSKINEIINKLSSQKNTVKLINKGDIKNTADLRNTLTDTLNEVTNGTFKMKSFNEETKTMTGTFKNSKGEIQNVSANLDDLENNIGKVNVSFKESTQSATWFSKALTSIGKKFLEVGKYILTYVGMSEVWNTFKQGIKYVVEFDSAMTELIKVSNDSIVALKSFGKESFNIAQQVGGTGTTITQAAADWSRLGYSIKEASELAKNSAIYVNVGDGIDVEQATSSLVSTMKGFGLAAEDSMSIIDKFNEVSNNFAISSGGIGDALQRSAASFKEANTSLDSAIALITATMNKKMVVYMETYAKNTFNCWDSLRALHHNIEETTI